MNKKPLLSVGIIFKNEIRCIERCLKSLQKLKEFADCEIVMADTGADDGTREVAKQYADILIDFPWINDFAAARNAVMDRCSGKWYLNIDCDEWIEAPDGELQHMIHFLKYDRTYDYAGVVIRNFKILGEYTDASMFSDFSAVRFLRMSTGLRFQGAIHEKWPGPSDGSVQQVMIFPKLFLYHDGYAAGIWTKEKVDRNMTLLKQKHEDEPENLLVMVQLIESSGDEAYFREAVEAVEKHLPGWNVFGPVIMRHAVTAAMNGQWPELEKWIKEADEWFPGSIFTKIDMQYFAAGNDWNKCRYDECIRRCKIYFKAIDGFDAGKNLQETLLDPLSMTAPIWRENLRLYMVGSYTFLGKTGMALKELQKADPSVMANSQAENFARNCCQLYSFSELDMTEVIRDGWEKICAPVPSEDRAKGRKDAFLRYAWGVFQPGHIDGEPKQKGYKRPAYQVFRALDGICTLGTAAAVMDLEEPAELEEKLSCVENWDELPVSVLERAIERGIRFPLPGKTMPMEQLDRMAIRLTQESRNFSAVAKKFCSGELDDPVALQWARALALAGVKMQDWRNTDTSMDVARQFADVERKFIPRCYVPELLSDDAIWALPPMHRFGWYCSQAFQCKDNGDLTGYATLLHKGLKAAPEMKQLVEFLRDELKKEQAELRKAAIQDATPELLELAQKVKGILSGYEADDPALTGIKQSEIYKKIAWLIEDPVGVKQ